MNSVNSGRDFGLKQHDVKHGRMVSERPPGGRKILCDEAKSSNGADSRLPAPDFRAGERTFSLLTQVAGRAGRGELKGEVIVQTQRAGGLPYDFGRFELREEAWSEAPPDAGPRRLPVL